MKTKLTVIAMASVLTLAVFCDRAAAQKLSAEDLNRRTIERRAVEAIIWGIPMVNFDLMYQSFVHDAKGGENQILYWSGLADWKNQYLTPNPDTIYLMPFFNTKDAGPMVLEIPPAGDGSITGTIMDSWQMALEDVGPAGVDKGKGGKYLILPPDYKEKVPEGYIPLPSQTYQGYALLRSILKSRDQADIAKAVEYGKRIQLYPLSSAANPLKTTFVDAINVVVSGVIPYDVRFFQSLDRMVQAEPWIERDRAMIDPLKSLGIEKGKPFLPDEKTAAMLKSAAQEALALFDLRYETSYEPHNKGTRWFLPADKDLMESVESGFTKTGVYPTDGRGTLFYFEPVEERDRFFHAFLKPLGIEKGKPFRPDARQKKILTDAAEVGFLMAQTISMEPRFEGVTVYSGTHWEYAITLNPSQEAETYSQLDERTDYTFEAITMAEGMIKKLVGAGSQYLSAAKDQTGAWLDGGKTYRLTIPANPPVREFWAVTVYDNLTRSMIQTDTNKAGLSTRDKLQTNADGSMDLWFGPTAPAGKESNWIKTVPGKGWFTYFRAYSPTEAFFDKTWKLPDIETVK